LTATATSGLMVSYASSNLAVATVLGNIVTIVGIGSTDITASQAGNATYDIAADVSQNLTVNQGAATISSFTPTSAEAGATVTITGSNFMGTTAVSFGGTAASSYTVVNATTINAVVGAGASGSVSVTTPQNVATLSGFTFVTPAVLSISSFSPTSANAGATVTISGTKFLGTTAVSFGGTAAASFTVVDDNTINAVVASGTSGSVSVTAPDGSVSLTGFAFTVPNTWTGGTDNWNVAGNWSYGTVPVSSEDILINTGNPKMDVDVTIAGTLTINGTGSLTINPLKTLTIPGMANFGGKLVAVKSDNTGSGSIGVITGILTGATNVTVERYIPDNTFRSWRLLSVPTYGSAQTINGAWQEGNIPLENNTPGYGTQITSPSGTGFDDVSPNPSMYKYNGTALEAITNTGDAIATNQGYFLYVRGDRSIGMSSSTTGSTATTLRTNGTLYQGSQTSETILANNYGLVGNPYASAINFASLTRTGGVTNAFYIWDAKKQSGNSLGMYQTFSSTNSFVPIISDGSYPAGQVNTAIQSGQAFFVYADGAEGSVQIPDSSKAASSGTLGYKNVSELVKIDSRLYSVVGANTTMADANVVVFDAAYSNAVDGDDAIKFSNNGENLGILKAGKILAIEGHQPVTAADTIFFKMWNMQAHAYQLELIPQNLGSQNLVARLEDSYLNTSTVVSLADTNRINFAVDATPASYVSNRFRIVFTPAVIVPVNFISLAASRKTTNVLVNWKVGNELNIHHYEVER
ncbi:MAG: IPT/TIG domain-containing protein, partial [Ferruginibacter sp.]